MVPPKKVVIMLIGLLHIAELPFGWEELDDKVLGSYFIDHNTGKSFINIFFFLLIMMPNRVFNDHIMSGYTQVIQELINSMGTLYFGKGKGFGIILKTERDIHWKLKFSLLRFQIQVLLEFFSIPSSLATTEKVDPKKLGYFCWNTLCKTKISDKYGPKERGLLFMCILLTRIISIIHDI